MTHRATRGFWQQYRALPRNVRRAADRQYRRLRDDPRHPSLHFKSVPGGYSVRVSLDYRALARPQPDGALVWVWIGSHAEYDKLLGR